MGMKDKSQKAIHIGMVINTAVKPTRDVMLGILDCARRRKLAFPRLFHASAATSPENLAKFARSGLDGILMCGVRREIVREFLRIQPCHPPIVLCIYTPLLKTEEVLSKIGGTVLLDNEAIGRQAADFFLGHGLQHFAFIANSIYREQIAGELRSAAFEGRLRAVLGEHMKFERFFAGFVAENEDFWEADEGDLERFLLSLPLPCGIFVNSDREAVNVLSTCRQLGLDIPGQIEVLGVNNIYGLCEHIKPTLSSIFPDHRQCAEKAVEMLLALIADPDLPPERRNVRVSDNRLVERGSTASQRDFGHIASRVREFVRVNACNGIGVMDVVNHLGVSRRVIEKRVREATGQSVLDMIQKVKLENVCRLLEKTELSITEITMNSGYGLSSNLGKLFRKTFGMSMRDYRAKNSQTH